MRIIRAACGNYNLSAAEYGDITELGMLEEVIPIDPNVFVLIVESTFQEERRFAFRFDEVMVQRGGETLIVQTKRFEENSFQPVYRRIDQAIWDMADIAYMDGEYSLYLNMIGNQMIDGKNGCERTLQEMR